MRGTVRMWSESRGFGFVEPEGKKSGDRDVFVHFSGIEKNGSGRRNLSEGDRVEFEVEDTEKGLQAVRVRVV